MPPFNKLIHNSLNLLTDNISKAFVTITLTFIACAMNFPVSIYTNAGHDDLLFISHAYNVLQGQWLGTYSQMTLAKGAGYSIFLAANATLGIPITLSIALFYAYSVWWLTTRLIKLGLPKIAALIFFTLLLFHPEIFPVRIIRDNIYPALSLLAFAAVIDVCFLAQRRIGILFLYGLAIAFFWITREEGVWVVPALAMLILFRGISSWIVEPRSEFKAFIKQLVILGVFVSLPILLVCTINFIKYGAFLTVDFKDRPFAKSLSILNSIDSTSRISHVPVNKEQRGIAYSVSPAFAELRTFFEETGTSWTQPGCNIYPETCGDYAGGWFMWAYRDAVQQRGYYASYKQAREFYQRVTDELTRACKTGKIQCNSGSIGFLPNLSKEQLGKIPAGIIKSYKLLTTQLPVSLHGGPSVHAEGRLNSVKLFLRNPFSVPSPEEDIIRISGWYYDSQSTENWITLRCSNQADNMLIDRINSPDIASAMNNSSATLQRFSFTVAAQNECVLSNHQNESINLKTIMEGENGPFSVGEATLFIDSVNRAIPVSLYNAADSVKQKITAVYKTILPWLFWAGVIAFFLNLFRYVFMKTWPSWLFICALAAWGLVATRVAILILIDISSFPAIGSLYMGPAFPLLIAAIFLSIFSFSFSRKP